MLKEYPFASDHEDSPSIFARTFEFPVDMATDAKLRAALSKLDEDITVIIIAQRIASVQDADKIIVLDEGRITDVGTHEELMAKSDIYRDVFESQKKGVE